MTAAPLARVLRITDQFRTQTVRTMLQRHRTEAPSYWTQLVLSAGIATFGLVLNSGAVIIGAMLIAPMMGPIVELAMGLAVGSALLALRSALRIAISIGVAVFSAGILTRLLPFQEVTAEVASRTSPTVLDLMVACFCALTAAFVTLKPHDTMATAAGTSIGIALVPPLCASGFGIGVGLPHVAGGALLLFVANLSAILLFSVIVFLLAGFGSVKAALIELEVVGELEQQSPIIRVSTRLNTLFGSRHSTVFKLVLPVTLVGAVFVPLQRALGTVSAEVQARQKVAAILNEKPELKNALLTTVSFDHGGLSVRLVVVGEPAKAKELENHLRERVAARIEGHSTVSVVGVPDSAAVARLAAALKPSALPPPPPPPPPPILPLSELNERIREAIDERYPAEEAGKLLAWSLYGSKDPPELRLTHLGAPMGPAATRLLGEALSEPLHGPVTVLDDALPPTPQTVENAERLAVELATLRARISTLPGLRPCLEVPITPFQKATLGQKFFIKKSAELGVPESDIREGATWTIRISQDPCSTPEKPK